ncbi:MAG: glucose-6-phosphate isomerase [Endomicrobia bacterium]|nr:glucose-6-phosphate isomerase [Endomicrobiia bacterium]
MIILKYDNALDEKIYNEGLSKNHLFQNQKKFVEIHTTLNQKIKDENLMLGWAELPYINFEVDKILKMVQQVKNKFDTLLVLGIGGSALGNIALQTALRDKFWNSLSKQQRKGYLKIYVFDNVDPDTAKSLINHLDIKKTLINVISKAGDTAETLATFFVFYNQLIKKVGKTKAKDHIIITTGPKTGFLRELVNQGYCRYDFTIPENVGGRFSVLSPVGLVSAALAGINIKQLLLGAKNMAEYCKVGKPVEQKDMLNNPAFMFALINYLFYQKGKHICVMMAYSDRLYGFADWFRQLWAESLGKEKDNQGNTVNIGPTPIKALGVTDQHSQLQLYREGPNDKIIVFLSVEKFAAEVKIPKFPKPHYLSGHSLNELLKAEEKATMASLTQANRPNINIILPQINEESIGELIYMLELATAYAGELFNIDAFNQPGVVLGKNYTYALLGRKGYESYLQELKKFLDISS